MPRRGIAVPYTTVTMPCRCGPYLGFPKQGHRTARAGCVRDGPITVYLPRSAAGEGMAKGGTSGDQCSPVRTKGRRRSTSGPFVLRRAQCHDRLTREGFTRGRNGLDERRGACSRGTVRSEGSDERPFAGWLYPHPAEVDRRDCLSRELPLGEEVADGAVVMRRGQRVGIVPVGCLSGCDVVKPGNRVDGRAAERHGPVQSDESSQK